MGKGATTFMLISSRMADAVNEQIGREFGAMLQYVEISSYFQEESLPELAAFFLAQSEDERSHAMRFVKYILDARGHVAIPAIAAPRNDFRSAEDAVNQALKWETEVTGQINELVKLAIEESDYTSHSFLQWFINEQLEEVSTMDTLLDTVKRAGEDRILHVEEFLARRGGHKAIADGGTQSG